MPWADLASGALLRIVKSGPISEDCSLKKKKVTAIVGHFSLNGKGPTKKHYFLLKIVVNFNLKKNISISRGSVYNMIELKRNQRVKGDDSVTYYVKR